MVYRAQKIDVQYLTAIMTSKAVSTFKMLSFASRPQYMTRQNELVTPYSSPIPGGVLDFLALCLSEAHMDHNKYKLSSSPASWVWPTP